MTREGWTENEDGDGWDHNDTGCMVTLDDEGTYWWEVGYMTSGTRLDPPDWRPCADGSAPTLDEAMRSVEWIVAVEEAEQARMDALIEETVEAAEAEWERQVAEGQL